MNERARNAQLVKKGLKDWRMNSGWPNESVNEWMNEWMTDWVSERASERTNKGIHEWILQKSTDRLLDGQADESISNWYFFDWGFEAVGPIVCLVWCFEVGPMKHESNRSAPGSFLMTLHWQQRCWERDALFSACHPWSPISICVGWGIYIYIYILAPQDHDKHSLTTTKIWNSHHLLKFIFPFVRPWRPAIGWKVLNVRRVGHFGPFWGRCSGAAKWFFHVVRLGNVVKTRGPFGFRVFLRCFSWAVTGGVAHWW